MNDCIYKIRPHHGMCISFFRGKGYSDEFTSHMARIVSELSADPLVEIISATDELCEKCPSNMGDGICQTEEKVARYDSELLRYCGFSAGEVMPLFRVQLCGPGEDHPTRKKRSNLRRLTVERDL